MEASWIPSASAAWSVVVADVELEQFDIAVAVVPAKLVVAVVVDAEHSRIRL